MTLKTTIITSAATCLIIHLAISVLGWLIWPLVWIYLGYASLRFWEWTLNQMYPHSDNTPDMRDVIICVCFGPLALAIIFISDGYKYVKLPNWLPKIRNPFVWTNDD